MIDYAYCPIGPADPSPDDQPISRDPEPRMATGARRKCLLGGGDTGKTTILEAIALLLSPTNATVISDTDFWDREMEPGFCIEGVMSLPDASLINHQAKQAWPWEWNGTEAVKPKAEEELTAGAAEEVYLLRVRGTAEFDLVYEIIQPDGNADHLPVAVRRRIGLVRLSGDDRNDRDLRLLQGSALDRLLSDKALRSRLGQKLAGTDVETELKAEAKEALSKLDTSFQEQALPTGLGLGLTGGQGFSVNAMIGLLATKDKVKLPLAAWGAGTRRLAALEIAAANQGENPITVVDEVERGLEPYRQRGLMADLQDSKSQVFATTHSVAVIGASSKASLWYVDAKGCIGRLPKTVAPLQRRDPETFLARLAVIAEGVTEVGFVRALLARALDSDLLDHGLWITDGGGNYQTLQLLEDLLKSGLAFAGFADDEGDNPNKWQAVKKQIGPLLFRWPTGCLEENIIKLVTNERLEDFIKVPDGSSGNRLRTLADRLGIQNKDFVAITKESNDLRELIIEAAAGKGQSSNKNCTLNEKELKAHARIWFKHEEGGRELADKVFSFGLWPDLEAQLLPFVNAILGAVSLPPVTKLQ